ncbi:dienelactone hydrolase [Entophlyctis helioformis]|nr:dienelactone hydrolase [Entophlyctis helioformis]
MPAITFEGVPYFVEGKEGSEAGVIVIQEWWGVNDQIKRVTARYAESLNGLAITPDLYRGKVATAADEANHLMGALNWPQAVDDVRNAVKYLKSKGVKKVGIVGFCMGGALTIASGVLVPELSAGVCFYGVPPLALADPKNMQIPMQYNFGEHDDAKGFSDKETALKLKATLEAAGKDVSEFYMWDAGHAFMNEDAPAYPYNEKCAKEAYAKSVAFFAKHLH